VSEILFERATRVYAGSDAAAVDALDLLVEDGEFMVLVGPSGSGKSTALRMIAGLEPLDSGGIWIGGRDVTWERPQDRDVAMVFQNYALYPFLSVADNIGFPLKMAKVPKDLRREKVRAAADLLGLSALLERKPAQLSGGQRQRVAMGRAIVREPSAFLMDEPLSNLDALLRVQMRAEIASLQARLGTTTVYVTHDQVEAMTMGTRVAVLRDGRLQQCATPEELYERPANVFVAGFMGSPPMNLLTLPLNGGRAIDLGGASVEPPEAVRAAAAQGGLSEVVVGIRPEHIHIGADGGIAARAQRLEHLGADSHVTCAVLAGGREQQHVVRTSGERAPRGEEHVALAVAAGAYHWFSPASGERLNRGS
jgi:multiple sugar transport system ATP-binding protein